MRKHIKQYKKIFGLLILAAFLATTSYFFIFSKQELKEKTRQSGSENGEGKLVTELKPIGRGKLLPPPPPPGFLESQMISLEEAQKKVPVKIALPTYLPEGISLKGVVIYPAPPDNSQKAFGEISLYYTKGVQIAEYPLHQPFDVKGFLRFDAENLPSRAPDSQGKKHIFQEIKAKGRVGVGRDQYDQVVGRVSEDDLSKNIQSNMRDDGNKGVELNHVPSTVTFDIDGTNGFEYLVVSVAGDLHGPSISLEETLKIAESMEYPE